MIRGATNGAATRPGADETAAEALRIAEVSISLDAERPEVRVKVRVRVRVKG